MMWPAVFELGAWCVAGMAVSLGPRTRRRGALLAVCGVVALVAGTMTRLLNGPVWHPHMVDPSALVAASAAALVVAVAVELYEWHWRRKVGAVARRPVFASWQIASIDPG